MAATDVVVVMQGHKSKRLFDVVVVLLSAPAWLPLFGTVAILVRVKLGSPVFFRQMRPGYKATIFELIKFRTMTDARDRQGNRLPDAERLSSFGYWLRSTSLDELPELINVLRGEMSLVGPRPLLVEYLDRYSPEQLRRHECHPGLTGWCQVNGRNTLTWEQKFALDVWYVDHWSLWLDLKILFLTIKQVLSRHGVVAEGHATMPEFQPTSDRQEAGRQEEPQG